MMGRGCVLVRLLSLCAWLALPTLVVAQAAPAAPDAAVDADAGAQPSPGGGTAGDVVAPAPAGEPVPGDTTSAPPVAADTNAPETPATPDVAPTPEAPAAGAAAAAPPTTPAPPPAEPAPPAEAPTAPETPPVNDTIEVAPPANVAASPAVAPPEREVPAARTLGEPQLYVRLAAGVGFPFGFDVSDHYADLQDDERARFSGLTFATELMIGAPLADWIVVGGGWISDTVTSGQAEERDGNTHDFDRSLYLAMIGPFVDIYPAAPAGFHAQALIGFTHLSRARNLGDHEAVGPSAALAVGYEWRVSSRWNVGILGRMTVAPLSMDPVEGVSRSPVFYQPTLLITATMRP